MYDNLQQEIITLFTQGMSAGVVYGSIMFVIGYVINSLLSMFFKG